MNQLSIQQLQCSRYNHKMDYIGICKINNIQCLVCQKCLQENKNMVKEFIQFDQLKQIINDQLISEHAKIEEILKLSQQINQKFQQHISEKQNYTILLAEFKQKWSEIGNKSCEQYLILIKKNKVSEKIFRGQFYESISHQTQQLLSKIDQWNTLQSEQQLSEPVQISDLSILPQEQQPFVEPIQNQSSAQNIDPIIDDSENIFKAYQLIDQARNLKAFNNFSEAIKLFDESLRYDPANDEAYFLKGETLYQLKEFQKALETIDRCINLNKKYGQAYFLKGVVLNNLGRYAQALEQLELAEKFEETHSSILFANMATSLNDVQRYESAIEYSDKALVFDPDCAGAYNNKAIAYRSLGMINEACQAYQKAIQLNPYEQVYIMNFAILLFEVQKYDQALLEFDKVKQLNSQNPRIYKYKCIILRLQNKNNEALDNANKWIQNDPTDILALQQKYEILQTLGRAVEANQIKQLLQNRNSQ